MVGYSMMVNSLFLKKKNDRKKCVFFLIRFYQGFYTSSERPEKKKNICLFLL